VIGFTAQLKLFGGLRHSPRDPTGARVIFAGMNAER
jgi:hypothetical protein